MADKMLIDASHEEETRVVVVRGNRIEEFDFESEHKKQIRGNIYLAKVTRVEPSFRRRSSITVEIATGFSLLRKSTLTITRSRSPTVRRSSRRKPRIIAAATTLNRLTPPSPAHRLSIYRRRTSRMSASLPSARRLTPWSWTKPLPLPLPKRYPKT